MDPVRKKVCRMPSLLTTTVTKPVQMAPFEALYGRRCRTPLNWSETGDSRIFGPDMLKEAEEKVKTIRERLKTAQSRQKSYYDRKHREISFEPGELVYLRVSPMKGLQ